MIEAKSLEGVQEYSDYLLFDTLSNGSKGQLG